MRLPITLLLLLAVAAPVWAEAPSLDGTLPEDYLPGLKPFLKAAVERSPTTINASIGLAQAEAGRYLQAAALWPSLSAYSQYTVTTESIAQNSTLSTTGKGFFYGASINQPIFEWGAYKNQAQIGSLGVKIAQRQFADAYRSLAVTIREQYMGLVYKKKYLLNARFQQKIAEEQLAAQHARFEAGSVSEAELQGFNMNVDDATLAADRADEDFHYAKRVFARLVGIDDPSDDAIPSELPHPDYSASLADTVLTGFVGEGIESTFQNEVYHMMLEQQDKSYSIAKVRLLPKLNAGANYSYSQNTSLGQNYISVEAIKTETYNIGANWTIFDGFSTRGAKLSALESRRSIERMRQTYIDNTIDTITYMRHQLGFSQRAMALSEVRNALIEAQVKRLGDDKALGYASQATIDAGVLTLDSTQYNMAVARSGFLSQWVEFISLAGLDPAIANVPSRYVR